MEVTLARFVHALRSADVAVSPAETLDGLAVLRHVGVADPLLLRNALSLTLAKSREEKSRFADCFERFFHQLAFQQAPKRSLLPEDNRQALLQYVGEQHGEQLVSLLRQAMDTDRSELALAVQLEAQRLNVQGMQSLREKSSFADAIARALGLLDLEELLARPAEPGHEPLLVSLRYLRQYLREEIRGYLDAQYQLNVDATGKRAMIEAALQSNLDQLPPDYYAEVDRVVRKLADRLAQQHKRRRRKTDRGVLDIKQTIRNNVAYDGALFDLKFRQRKIERSDVFVICDVSNSVARIARFLLLFLYDLAEVLPSVRSFVFSNRLGEVTQLFQRQPPERAIEEALVSWGKGTTDYGRAMLDLRDLIQHDVDHRSTLIFLGDARANYFDPRADVLRALSQRARQVFWLNPETRDQWGEGDSVMQRYAPHCLRTDTCSRLRDIERFADRLLSDTR